MGSEINYTFYEKELCNMCNSPTVGHRKMGQRMNRSQGLTPKSKTAVSVSVMKCADCGLIYANPQPIPNVHDDHDFSGVWSDDYYKYDENYLDWEIVKAKELLNFKEGMKVLDVGAGIGKALRSLERAGFDAWGFEPSKAACEAAFEKLNISREKLLCGTIESANYPDESFDFVNFGAVLEHLYDPALSLKRALKWLKPGGIIYAEVPNANYFISKIFNFYYRLTGTDYTCHISPMHEPYHHFEFSRKSFEKFCENNGCHIVNFQVIVAQTPFIPKTFVPLVDKYMDLTKTGMQISTYIKKNS